MKYFVVIVCVMSAVACASYLLCAYVMVKHMTHRWLRAFLAILLVEAAISRGLVFCRIVDWFKTPLIVTLIISAVASITGIGMFLTFSGWLKNGKG